MLFGDQGYHEQMTLKQVKLCCHVLAAMKEERWNERGNGRWRKYKVPGTKKIICT